MGAVDLDLIGRKSRSSVLNLLSARRLWIAECCFGLPWVLVSLRVLTACRLKDWPLGRREPCVWLISGHADRPCLWVMS